MQDRHPSNRQQRLLRWVSAMMLVCLLAGPFTGLAAAAAPLAAPAPAVPNEADTPTDETLVLSPSSVHPGGTIRVSGSGYTPNTTYYMLLGPMQDAPDGQSSPAIDYYPIYSNHRGQLLGTFTFSPMQNPGAWYELYISTTAGPPSIVAYAPVTVLSAMTYLLNPNHGAPGDSISFTAGNLEPGWLTIDIEGQVVFGPRFELSGAIQGTFTVPRNVRGIPGEELEVNFVNTVDNLVNGRATAAFTLEAAASQPEYEFIYLAITPTVIAPGMPFTITGMVAQITGQADQPFAPAQLRAIDALWTDVDSSVNFPISEMNASLDANGGFVITGIGASTVLGDPRSMRDDLSVNLLGHLADATVAGQITAPPPITETLQVYAYDVDTLAPIPDVLYTLEYLCSPIVIGNYIGSCATVDNNASAVGIDGGGLRNVSEGLSTVRYNPDDADWGALTDVSGNARIILDGEKLFGNPLNTLTLDALYGQALEQQFALDANAGGDPADNWYPDEPGWEKYRLTVTGRHLRYFYDDPALADDSRTSYSTIIWYKPTSNLRDQWGGFLYIDQPVEVPMHYIEIPSPFDAGGPTELVLTINHGNYPNNTYAGWPLVSGFLDFTALTDSGLSILLPSVTVEAVVGAGWLPIQTPTLWLDGVQVASFYLTALNKYTATFTYPARLSSGSYHELAIKGTYDEWQDPLERRIYLQASPAAPWLTDSTHYSERQVTYSFTDETFTFRGRELNPAEDSYGAEEISTLPDQTPELGALTNNLTPSAYVTEKVFPEGARDRVYDFTSEAPQTLSQLGESAALSGQGGSITISASFEPLLAIVLPLWAGALSDPLGGWLVTFTSGAYLQSMAYLYINGTVQFNSSGNVSTNLNLNAQAYIDGVMFVTADVLMGILGHAEFNFYPSIDLNMPLALVNGVPQVGMISFTTAMSLGYFLGAGCITIPFVGTECLISTSDTVPLFSVTLPDACKAAALAQVIPSTQRAGPDNPNDPLCQAEAAAQVFWPERLIPAMAADGLGMVTTVWKNDRHTIRVADYQNGEWTVLTLPITSLGGDVPAIAYYQPGQSVITWNAYDGDEATLPTLPITDSMSATYVAWGLYENETLTEVGPLAEAGNGAGGAALGSCVAGEYGCPAAGEVTAAWLVDLVPGMANTRTQIYYRIFDGSAWGSPAAIPLTAPASQAQPQVVYQDGAPLIIFLSDADGSFATSDDRRIAFFDPANPGVVDTPSDLLGGVVEFSAALDPSGQLHLAITRIDSPEVGLIDNRHTLFMANRTCSGGCSWEYHKIQDSFGRDIYAESPSLTFNSLGEANLAYRALGLSEDRYTSFEPHYGDTPGILARTGEQAHLNFAPGQSRANPTYLTSDGAVNWDIASVYDSFSRQVVQVGLSYGAGVAADALPGLNFNPGVRARPLAAEDGLMFAALTEQPDFALYAEAPASPYIADGQTTVVTVTVQNLGVGWTSNGYPLRIAATWDEVDGAGEPAGEALLDALDAGSAITVTLVISAPLNPAITHTLHVEALPPAAVGERSSDNNAATLTLGGLPAPTGLGVTAQDGLPIAHLTWDPSPDGRVTYYRIYRSVDGGEFQPAGSALAAEWWDENALTGHLFAYRVTACANNGEESAPSQTTATEIFALPELTIIYLPLIRR